MREVVGLVKKVFDPLPIFCQLAASPTHSSRSVATPCCGTLLAPGAILVPVVELSHCVRGLGSIGATPEVLCFQDLTAMPDHRFGCARQPTSSAGRHLRSNRPRCLPGDSFGPIRRGPFLRPGVVITGAAQTRGMLASLHADERFPGRGCRRRVCKRLKPMSRPLGQFARSPIAAQFDDGCMPLKTQPILGGHRRDVPDTAARRTMIVATGRPPAQPNGTAASVTVWERAGTLTAAPRHRALRHVIGRRGLPTSASSEAHFGPSGRRHFGRAVRGQTMTPTPRRFMRTPEPKLAGHPSTVTIWRWFAESSTGRS